MKHALTPKPRVHALKALASALPCLARPVFTLVSLQLFFCSPDLLAATKTFSSSAGAWLTAGNWSPSGVPTSSDDVLVNAGTTTMTLTAADLTIQYLTFTNGSSRILQNSTGTSTASNLTLSGVDGSGNLINVSPTFGTPTFTIQNGTTAALNLVLGASGNFNVSSIGTLTISSAISETGTSRSITKTGPGTLTLSGTNTYTGATGINRGTLTLSGSISSSSALALGGGVLNYTPTAAGSTQTFNGTTINSGFSTVTNATSGNTVALGSLTRNAGGILSVSSLTGTTTTSAAVDSTGILGTWASTGTSTGLRYAAGGSGGAITGYAGGTAAATAASVTDTTGTTNYDVAAVGTLGADASVNTLRYTGTAGTIAGALTANGLMNAGTGALTFSGSLTIGASQELIVLSNTQATTISGNISNNVGGASSLVYGGPAAGILTLSGSNSYTGGTVVNSGIVRVANVNAVGNVLVNGGGTLNIDGVTMTLAGDITGAGAVTKTNNASVLTMNGNNTFSGGMTLGDGTLILGTGSNNGIGTGILTLSAGSLRSSDNNVRTINNALSMGSASLTLGGTQGAVTNLGDLTFTSTASTAVGGAKTWTVNNATTVTFNNPWSGNAGHHVTKAGTGTLVFNGNLSHNTSNVTVNAGNLTLNGTTNSYGGTTTVSGSGTLQINGAKTGVGTVAANSGGTLSGTGSVAGVLTVASGGSISPGSGTGSSGTLSVADTTWNGDGGSFAQMKFDLGNTANQGVLATSDRLALTLGTGVLTKGTAGVFAFDFGGTGAAGNTYTLMTFASSSGFVVGDFTYSALAGGLTGSFTLGSGSLTFLVVPEPGSALILLGGLAVLGFCRRQRRSR